MRTEERLQDERGEVSGDQPDPEPTSRQRAVGIALLAVMCLVVGYLIFLAVAYFMSGGGA